MRAGLGLTQGVRTGRCRNAGYVTGTPIACEAEFVEFAFACDRDLPSKDGGFDSFWVVTEARTTAGVAYPFEIVSKFLERTFVRRWLAVQWHITLSLPFCL